MANTVIVNIPEELERRLTIKEACEVSEDFKKSALERYAQDPVAWISDWAFTYDPRLANYGLNPTIPFKLFLKQEELVYWLRDRFDSQEDGLIEKSRDVGVTSLCAAFSVWCWLFRYGSKVTFGSRKEGLVDLKGDPDTIFAKIRLVTENLPMWMLPKSFIFKRDDNVLRIVNPDSGAALTGEGGDNMGRGGRSSLYFLDEFAFVDRQGSVDKAVSANSENKIYLSTVNGTELFWKKRHSGKIEVFVFPWESDPRKDEVWAKKKKNAMEPHDWASEYERDYTASIENIAIPAKWVKAAVNLELEFENGERHAGFDVAGGGKNLSVYIMREGPTVMKVSAWNEDNVGLSGAMAIEKATDDGVTQFNFDATGIGVDLESTFRNSDTLIPFSWAPIQGGEMASEEMWDKGTKRAKDKFANKRAELWWKLRRRFEKTYSHVNGVKEYDVAELISIPDNPNLVTQLSQPLRKTTNTGKIIIESKIDMKKRGIESPDHADSLVYAYADNAGVKRVLNAYRPAEFLKTFDINWYTSMSNSSTQFCGVHQSGDLTLSHVFAIWEALEGKLYIFGNIVTRADTIQNIAKLIRDEMHLEAYKVERFIGDESFFSEKEEARTLAKLYRKNGIKLRKPKRFDLQGAIAMTENMLTNKQILVHTDCRDTHQQLMSWDIKKDKPSKNNGCAYALCLIVSELNRYIGLYSKIRTVPRYEKRHTFQNKNGWQGV